MCSNSVLVCGRTFMSLFEPIWHGHRECSMSAERCIVTFFYTNEHNIYESVNKYFLCNISPWSGIGGLAFSTQVHGFKPGRSRQIFKVEKILSTPSFGGEVKPSVPCRCGCGGNWRRNLERLNVGESNGKLPLRTCPGCSIPEPYRSLDWALVPAQTSPRAEY